MTKAHANTRELIENIAFKMFGRAQTSERRRFLAHIIVFASAIFSQFATDYWLYVVALFAFLAGLTALLFRLISYRANVLGHSLYRLAFLAKAYGMDEDGFDPSYLISKVPSDLYNSAIQEATTQSQSGTYNLPANESGIKKLRWMVQENAFFNSTLYKICARQTLNSILIIGSVLAASVLIVIPLADGDTEFLVLRLFLIFLSLAVFYDQIESWNAWRSASRVMTEIENELSRFRDLPEHRAFLLFSNYQATICNSPTITQRAYKQNHKRLNKAWDKRISSLRDEWKNY